MTFQPRAADDGFTLIEVLVAFVVLALALAGVYAMLGDSARLQADLALRDSAMADAQSQLDRMVAGPLVAGEATGRFSSGTVWHAVVTPLARTGSSTGIGSAADAVVPARVVLTLRDGRNRILAQFDTIALIPGAP